MRISTAEVLDCLSQLDSLNACDENRFYTILRANFAKSRRDQTEFERLYTLFFKEMKKQGLPAVLDGEIPEEDAPLPGQDLAQIIDVRALKQDLGTTDLDHALLDMLNGDPKAFIAVVRQIHDQETEATQAVKSNLGQLTGRLEVMLSINKMRQKVVQFLGGPDAPVDPSERRRFEMVAEQRFQKALTFLNEDVQPDNAGLKSAGPGDLRYPGLGQVPFSNLTHNEIVRVQEVVDEWVRKLNEISSLRFAAARKGMVDVKRTIRRSGRYLGVPVEIVRKNKPLRKGKIVTLCDVSGSVWSTARFMLNVLYSLQVCFARVKSYIFIERPLEVSGYFLNHDANGAAKKILQDKRINYNARTDYGLVFQEFRDHHLGDLDKKTTLILIGDGRSNYLNPREPVLETLRDRCRRLVWLNPEQERFWGTGDSEMLRYRHYCNEARACGNLNQLIDFIQDLVL